MIFLTLLEGVIVMIELGLILIFIGLFILIKENKKRKQFWKDYYKREYWYDYYREPYWKDYYKNNRRR